MLFSGFREPWYNQPGLLLLPQPERHIPCRWYWWWSGVPGHIGESFLCVLCRWSTQGRGGGGVSLNRNWVAEILLFSSALQKLHSALCTCTATSNVSPVSQVVRSVKSSCQSSHLVSQVVLWVESSCESCRPVSQVVLWVKSSFESGRCVGQVILSSLCRGQCG